MSNNSQDSHNQEDKVIIDTNSANNNNNANFNIEELICKFIIIFCIQHQIIKM